MTDSIMPNEADFHYLVQDAETLLAHFTNAPNWQERYRQIMLLGKDLPSLSPELRIEAA
ncbi:MAG: Fe-S metabolism protein SufE, partial [Shewanella oncorhynchi]